MNSLSRSRWMLLLLAILFMTPGITALYFFKHPELLNGATTNRGAFVRSSLQIDSLNNHVSSLKNKFSESKPQWHLVLWYPENCQKDCLTTLEQLNKIRLALGRHYYEINEALMAAEGSKQVPEETQTRLKEQQIETILISKKKVDRMKASSMPTIYIANPQGFLVLSYPIATQSDDIYHDLKKLLTSTQS